MDCGRDAVDLLGQLVDNYGAGPHYIVVQNQGRGSDFVLLRNSKALQRAQAHDAYLIELPRLHDASMRTIDQYNTIFWKASNDRQGPDSPGLLERQRVKTWLKKSYELFDRLPV